MKPKERDKIMDGLMQITMLLIINSKRLQKQISEKLSRSIIKICIGNINQKIMTLFHTSSVRQFINHLSGNGTQKSFYMHTLSKLHKYKDMYKKLYENFENLYKTDTSIRQTDLLFPRGVCLKRYYCTLIWGKILLFVLYIYAFVVFLFVTVKPLRTDIL